MLFQVVAELEFHHQYFRGADPVERTVCRITFESSVVQLVVYSFEEFELAVVA